MFDYRLEEDASRFAVFYENEEIGEISFVKTGEHLLIIDHTYVDAKWKGHAIGNALVQKVVDFAVADNRKIIPLCPFAKKVFDRTPEYEAVKPMRQQICRRFAIHKVQGVRLRHPHQT